MASLQQRQRMKLSFSTRSLPHHRKTLPTNSTSSSPHQSWAYTLLNTRLGMCQGKQERSHMKRHRQPGKDSSQGTSYRPISLLCPAAKVMEALILPEVNYHLLPSPDQHGFRPAHSTTSALLQLTTDIATGFNQRKPPDRTVCIAVDLTAAVDTVCHNTLISKIARSTLPSPTTRWLSCYLRGRQARTSCRGVKSSARIVHAGVPQGSKLSPSLFSFYLADMPRPTEPVKRVCYADDITVWASGVQIPVLEQQINSYLEEMSTFLKDNSLLISAPKSTVTLFTPDPFQARFHPKIAIADAILPLERTPKILGVLLDTSFVFHHHCEYVANRVSKRNSILKALAGTAERDPANDIQGRRSFDR